MDQNNEYPQFTEKLYSKVEFLWKESISGSYEHAGEGFYKKVDRIILLSGLYKDNKETFEALLNAAEKYDIPIVLVRPLGLEEVPEILEEKAATIVGWNANCIIDSIKDAPETM
ncbi:nuclease [Methanobrevibacter sp.]|uniref:nuclease n=1 Tax=Methanobrevibacter sp. TaxID=66852 RepID=UPI00388D70F1